MKVGIITIHNSTSYGACLQSYALWKYIVKQGLDCEIIDLRRPVHGDYKKSKNFTPMHPVTVSLKSKFIAKIVEFIAPLMNKGIRDREKKFDQFNAQIVLSKRYHSVDSIYETPPSYDLYITGSDQVWNPYQPFCMEPYFLTFVTDKKAKKISYASSIGLTELSKREQELFRKWLDTYDAIGVREQEAQNLIASFSEKSTTLVLDPTFLLDKQDWLKQIVPCRISKPYVLLFTLNGNAELAKYACKYAESKGLHLVVIGGAVKNLIYRDFTYLNTVGPQEFLGLFNEAECVFTDSFHGTAFSIILGKGDFYSYISAGNERGSRITNLLSLLQIEERLLPVDKVAKMDIVSIRLNRKEMEEKLKLLQASSRQFLNQYLDEERI